MNRPATAPRRDKSPRRDKAQSGGAKEIFIGNIPFDVSEDELREIFSRPGPIVSISLVPDKETGRSKGFCFIEYRDTADAKCAVTNLNNHEIRGRQLKVDFKGSDKGDSSSAVNNNRRPMNSTVLGNGSGSPPSNITDDGDAVADIVGKMNRNQMLEILTQMKLLVDRDFERARQLLISEPFFAMAILHMEAKLGLITLPPANMTMSMQQVPDPAMHQMQQQFAVAPPVPVASDDHFANSLLTLQMLSGQSGHHLPMPVAQPPMNVGVGMMPPGGVSNEEAMLMEQLKMMTPEQVYYLNVPDEVRQQLLLVHSRIHRGQL